MTSITMYIKWVIRKLENERNPELKRLVKSTPIGLQTMCNEKPLNLKLFNLEGDRFANRNTRVKNGVCWALEGTLTSLSKIQPPTLLAI